ncbi:hypothetical protein SCH01S_53_00490 [Sphingomonas changbaiensis NBRC 104936]|uniref:Uncharacterized protein n=1 Tax=Sphingomonas changbaiensis NBRC 104936 TaxID=1219043 RepID=A0A0E9MT97_9SPHN|nr:hypothetical protein SCH01S_53_00490 [Sphingomonas changbaiensis NBRC 104936]
MGAPVLDINSLLASEQRSLLRARFSRATGARDREVAIAAGLAKSLRLTTYPHKSLSFELLT